MFRTLASSPTPSIWDEGKEDTQMGGGRSGLCYSLSLSYWEGLGRLGEGAKVGDEVPGVEDDLCRQHTQVEAF